MTAPAISGLSCPKCGSDVWDNRGNKKNPKSPDLKCKRAPACDWVQWPPKATPAPAGRQTSESQIGPTPPIPAPVAAHAAASADAPPTLEFAALSARYRECVVYVTREIAPYVTLDAQAIAAMSATLFIARNQKNV